MTTSREIVLNAAKTLAWDELEPRQREIYLGCARIELADRASVADRGVQAVPGEPVARLRSEGDGGAVVIDQIYRPLSVGTYEVFVAPSHCQCPACMNGTIHASDCSVHNMPAMPNGPCDCAAAPASLSVAQAEPSQLVIPRGKYRLVPVEPRPDCCNRGLDKHGRASGECCGGGNCAHDADVKRAEESWIAATLPSTPKAEGEGKQS